MQELFFQLIRLLAVRLGVRPVGMVEQFVHGASLTTSPLTTTNRHFLKKKNKIKCLQTKQFLRAICYVKTVSFNSKFLSYRKNKN